ncbi:SDR family NAD(P)-dependent oxidoreductase [Streptomyces sp. WG7]|uniref:SDR family NAD(P)-dependent oxidoreductase n=1 Tax=Streptomyces sp. WG7 TaxID=3417650 RepID=UPI003CF1E1E0
MTSTPTHGAPAGRRSGAGRPTATPLSRAMDTIKKLRAELDEAKARPADDAGPLAVVGVGLRLPGGIADLDGYWDALAEGRDLVRPMPEHRKEPFTAEWDALPHRGGHLDDVLGFDAAFFGVSPREARSLDPQHRLLLEVAWEALEDAALPPRALAESGRRTGLYVGVTGQDYRDWQPAGQEDAYWLTGNGHCFAAGRIAYTLGLMGPAVAVDTACSSSLTAVHLAGQALRRGECDVALAGGVNLILSPRSTRLIQQTNSLAPDGLCKTFDARANGFTRGEGCGVVVLKRLADARRDGDRVHAVVRGSAVNQDGRSSGFTAPNVRAQIALIRAALDDAGLSPAEIGAVEAHGTGTALGDPIEVEAIVAALDRSAGGAPLRIGSVKTGLGHLEAASGIAGLVRGVLSVQRRLLPPVVHLSTLNPRIQLDGTGIEFPREVLPWEAGDSGPGSCLGVSSFGMSGTNAHVVLGAPTERERTPAASDGGPVAGFELSARTEGALRAWAGLLAGRLAELPAEEYAAFAYTVTHGRARHGVRALVTAEDPRAALSALRELAAGGTPQAVRLTDAAPDAPADPATAGLARAVTSLPAYPWERVRYAPARDTDAGAGADSGRGTGTGSAGNADADSGTGTRSADNAGAGAGSGTGTQSADNAATDQAATDAGTRHVTDAAGADGPRTALPALHVAWTPYTPTVAPDAPDAPDSAADRPLLVAGDDTALVALLVQAARAGGNRPVEVLDTLPDSAAQWAAVRAEHPGDLLLALAAAPLPGSPDEPAPTRHAAALAAAATVAVRALPDGPGRVHLVTSGVRQVTGDDAIAAGDHGVLHGLAPVLALEFPRVWGGIVDLPADCGPEDASAALTALAARDAEDLLAVRAGQVHAARLRPAEEKPQPLPVRPDGTYLLSGGLGAIGRVVARDLASRGAGHLVLLGRRAEEELPAEAADLLAGLAASGTPTTYLRADVGDGPELAAALGALDALPPLRGVVHGAGAIERLPLAEAGEEAFATALHGKFTGAHWLRLLTDDRPLDFFVQLSSVSAVWGTSGYGAYAAANGALDAVAERAAASGRPAGSVAFGPWDLDGMADSEARTQLARMGVRPVTAAQGSAALAVAGPHGAHLVACDLDTDRFTAVMNAVRPRPLFDLLARPSAPAAATGPGSGADPDSPTGPGSGADADAGEAPVAPRDALRAAPGHRRPALVAAHVREVLAEILGHDDPAALPERTGFLDLGLDSIMAVDASARLSEVLGLDVGIGDIFGHPSLERLSAELTGRLSDAPATPAPRRTPAARPTTGTTTAPTTTGTTAVGTTAVGTPATGSTAATPTTALPAPATGTAGAQEPAPAAPAPEPIAVVGMAGRFPGADSVEDFWSLLEEGRDGVGPVPADRWDAERLGTPAQGGFLGDIRRFDAAFFDIPAREAESLDPQQRLLLEAAWHALEDAACAPSSLAGSRTGVFVGISNSDYARVMESGGADALDAYFPTGTALNAAAGRIAYYLGLHGPALAVDTACSSSLVALHLAVRSLRTGESDRALAGGVNVITAPTCSVAVSRAHMLSPEGRCKTFDASADGFVRAEGVGVLVLRRLSDALRDGDRVLAVVHGSAVNQDGASSGFTAPNGTAQRRVIREALADAGVEGADIDYLEAHGTGTSLGDPIEVEAAWDVLGPGRRPGEPLLIGSVKSNIGHCESASGMASLIKSVLALRHGRIPAGLHYSTPNPHVPWRDMNIRVVDGRVSWTPGDRPRLAGVSGFGFSGTNAHVVLGEAPAAAGSTVRSTPEPGALLLPLSAPDAAGLERVTAAWEEALEGADEELLPDLVAVAAAGRAHLPVRRAVLGTGREKLLSALRAAGAPGTAATRAPRVAFLFSGQGAQYFGMGRELYESEPVFASVFDDCDRILTPYLGDSLLNLVFYGDDPQAVNQTRITQPALVALELALAALWESWGVRAAAVMGHSVGEVAAAVHAGVLGREDGLALIAHRARLMQSTEPGGMLSVSGAPDSVAAWAEEAGVDVAAVNGPESVVVAGPKDLLDAFAARLTERGVRSRALTVSHAFHSRLMDPVLAEFEAAVAPLAFGAPRIPVIANVTGAEAADDTYDAGYFVRHIRQPVRFHEGARALADLDADVLLEVGPDRTLVNLVRAAGLTPAGGGVPSLRRGGVDRTQLLAAAGHLYEQGQDLDFARITGRPEGRAAAPRYPFADTSYWTTAVPAALAPAGGPRPGHGRHWGAELKSPALTGRAFSFARSTSFPAYLTDHRLYGTVVTPAASHLGTVLSALGGDGSPVLVRDLICPRALVIKDGEEYEVQITVDRPGADGSAELSVQSLVDPERGIWQRHIGGRCATPAVEETHRPRPADRAAFMAAADRHLTRDDFYDYFRSLGYTLGPSFRWIDEVWIRGDQALVRYRMPELPDDPAEYELYPGLIDSCFQSIAVFLVDEGAAEAPSLAIPFAARELSFHGRPATGGELWGEVRVLRAEPLANDRLRVETADLHLYAVDPATGGEHSVFRADEFRIRHASRAVLEAGLRGDGLVRTLDWVPLPQDSAAPLTAPVPVAVLGDAGDAQALVAALEAAGHQVSVHGDGLPDGPDRPDAGLVVDARWLTPRPSGAGAGTGAGTATGTDPGTGTDAETDTGTDAGPGTDDAPGAGAVLGAVRALAATLRALPPELPYVLLADGDAVRAPLREALFGLLSSLEAEQTERRLTRLRLDAGWRAEGVAALLGGLPEETRLALTDSGVRVARLVGVPAQPAARERAGGALITGGLGALGLAVAAAHAARGGDRVTLMARSAPGDVEQGVIDSLTASGVRVSLVRGDVTDPADVARAVAAATADGPLGTVYHLAGVNADGAFPSLTDASYEKVFHAKAVGADVLADAVAGHDPRSVVLFSSVSSVLGSPGQANYAAANGYLDGLAEALRERGLPAVGVNWGPWVPEAKGGMAAAAAVERAAQRIGIRPLTDADAALPLALAAEGAQDRLVVVALDPARYAGQAAGHPRAALVAALTEPVAAPRGASGEGEPAGWLRDRLAASGADDAERVLRDAVRSLVARMLGSDDGLPEDGSADAEGFSQLGLDSIMAIDLRAALAHAMGRDLPATIAIDHPSVLAMSGFLAASDPARTGSGGPASDPAPALAPAAAAAAPDPSGPLLPSADSLPSPDSLPTAGPLEGLSLDELLRAVTDDLAQDQ